MISGATNGPAEGINSRIKTIKARSRGFRNQERFANAIYFHSEASISTPMASRMTSRPPEMGKNPISSDGGSRCVWGQS